MGASGSRQWAAAGRSHESRLGSTGATSGTGRETIVGGGGEHQSEKGKERIKFHLHTFQKQEVKLNRLKVPPRKEYIENYEAKQEREYHKSQNSGDCSKKWKAASGSISALVATTF